MPIWIIERKSIKTAGLNLLYNCFYYDEIKIDAQSRSINWERGALYGIFEKQPNSYACISIDFIKKDIRCGNIYSYHILWRKI